MSIHPSLKVKGAASAKRNVMTRLERIKKLKAEGRFEEGQKIWGIPKTKSSL
jgi:small basic protein (TIGR04137 family)